MVGTIKIYTAKDLRRFRDRVNHGEQDLNAVLMTDIDILKADKYGEYISWTPIGYDGDGSTYDPSYTGYTGIFDGKGHTISGLYFYRDKGDSSLYLYDLNSKKSNIAGLFGVNTGTIKNVTVEGYIKNAIGDYTGCRDFTGGICAENWNVNLKSRSGVIENCVNKCTIEGFASTGGIVGNNEGIIRNCVNAGRIEGPGFCTSGIFGYGAGNGVVGCVNNGDVHITERVPSFNVLASNNFRFNEIGVGEGIDSTNQQNGKVIFPFQNSITGMYISYTQDHDLNHLKEVLLHDVNPEYVNELGQTYLHLLCNRSSYNKLKDPLMAEFIKIIATETNIDFGARDNDGKTAADYAKSPEIKNLIGSVDQEKKNMAIVDDDNSFSAIGF